MWIIVRKVSWGIQDTKSYLIWIQKTVEQDKAWYADRDPNTNEPKTTAQMFFTVYYAEKGDKMLHHFQGKIDMEQSEYKWAGNSDVNATWTSEVGEQFEYMYRLFFFCFSTKNGNVFLVYSRAL